MNTPANHMRRLRTILWLLVVVLCLPHGAYATRPWHLAKDGAGVIPDTCGVIEEILLHYDPEFEVELECLYTDLLAKLPPEIRIRVLCPTRTDAEFFACKWQQEICDRDIEIISVGCDISIWARDRYIARQPADLQSRSAGFVPATCIDYGPPKTNELRLPAMLTAARLAPGILESRLHVEGGNVVSNWKHVFVGSNVFEENKQLGPVTRLRQELYGVFGRTYIPVADREGAVPWCHVDMYLTPIDEKTILVGSPDLGEHLLSKYYGEDDEIVGDLVGWASSSGTYQAQFDAVAELATKRGYEVLRLPVVANQSEEWMITYNNVLLDERDGKRVAYLPLYNIPPLDDVAQGVYRALGFDIETIDVSGIYEYGGALRCVANVTERRMGQDTKTRRAHRRTPKLRLIDLAVRATALDQRHIDKQDVPAATATWRPPDAMATRRQDKPQATPYRQAA